MLFNSIHFLIFLPVVLILHWVLIEQWRKPLLLIASYYFYMSWNPWFGILLFGTTLIDWFVALQIQNSKFKISALRIFNSKSEVSNPKAGTAWLLVSIFSNLGVLAGFKYFAFLYNTFSFAGSLFDGHSPHYIEAIVIPLGLSFYTFHSLGYVIDVYRGKIDAEKNLGTFSLFVSFFPQLVAGPIARFNELGVQFREQPAFKIQLLISGAKIMLWGFFKKIVIADRLADFVNPIFHDPAHFNGLTLLFAGFLFAVQVYCDFSGYTDIATGVAKFFGYDLTLNYLRPLLSTSLHEFWKRNHISMTRWFRDYLYISMGGNRRSYNRFLLNIFLTFLISGLWHGARWTFVLWGAMHGIVYILEILLLKKLKISNRKLEIFGWLYFISFYVTSLIAFRANSFSDLKIIYKKIFSFDWHTSLFITDLKSLQDLFPLFLGIFGIAFIFLKEFSEEKKWFIKLPAYNTLMRPVFYVMLFILLFTIGNFNSNEFIYFHF